MVVDTVDDHHLTLVFCGNGSDYPMQFQPVYAFKDRTATGSSEHDVIEGEYFAHGIFFKYKEISINSGLGYRRSAACRGGWGRLSNPQLSQWDEEVSRLTALVTRKPIHSLADASIII